MRTSDFNVPTEGDATAQLQAALDAAQGGLLEWEPGHYTHGRLYPRNGTTIVMNGGVHLHKAFNAAGLLYMQDVEGTRIHANGAFAHGDDVAGSTVRAHNIYANGTIDCEINDLISDGSTPQKDCLYIGAGTGNKPNQRLKVRGGKYLRAKRNNISLVAGFNCLLEGMETAYATGGPGAGIDVEANQYGMVGNNTIRRVNSHHNQNAGIINSFGVGTFVDDCDAHDNGTVGVAISSGAGMVFAEGVYRKHVDMMGVTAFGMATGEVFVSALPPIGTPVMFSLRNSAQRPPELSGTYWIVSRHASPNSIILGRAVRHGEVTAFSTPGAGIMSFDPAESDIRVMAFVDGQSNRAEIRRTRAFRNGQHGFQIVGAGDARMADDCEARDNLGYSQAWFGYSRDLNIDRLRVSGQGIGAIVQSGGGRFRMRNGSFEKTGGRAVVMSYWTGAELRTNDIIDCGRMETSSNKAAVHLANISRPVADDNRITHGADNTTALYGLLADATCVGGIFTNNDLTGAGTTNANALRVPAGSTCSNNTGRDGSPL